MPKKYELVKDDTIIYEGKKLRRVRALMEFETTVGEHIRPGDLGGYIEGVKNLSQDGTAWVADEAIVAGSAKVKDNALVKNFAIVYGKAILSGSSIIGGYCVLGGNARMLESAQLAGKLFLGGNIRLKDHAILEGEGKVCI